MQNTYFTLIFVPQIVLYFLIPYLPEYSHPQIPKICDPILVTLLKMQPHYSQYNGENTTPSNGTSPLACC